MQDRSVGLDDRPLRGTRHPLDDGDVVEIDDRTQWNTAGFDRTAWRIRDGDTIVMVRFFTPTNRSAPGVALLCDIEVRDTHRGAGLALDTIAALNELIGVELHSSGNYTPKGYAALAGTVPTTQAPWDTPSVAFDDMVFVADWDTRTLRH